MSRVQRAASTPTGVNTNNQPIVSGEKSTWTDQSFQPCVPTYLESLRLWELSVNNLKTLYATRDQLLHEQQHQLDEWNKKQLHQHQSPGHIHVLSSSPSSARTSSSHPSPPATFNDKIDSVNRMINHLISFMVISLEQSYIQPVDTWQQQSSLRTTEECKSEEKQVEPVEDDQIECEVRRPSFAAPPILHAPTPSSTPPPPLTTLRVSSLTSSRNNSPMVSPSSSAFHSPIHTTQITNLGLSLEEPTELILDLSDPHSSSQTLRPLTNLLDLDKIVAKEQTMEEQEHKLHHHQRLLNQAQIANHQHTNNSNEQKQLTIRKTSDELMNRPSLLSLNTPIEPLLSSPPYYWHLSHVRDYFHSLFFTNSHPYAACVREFIRRNTDEQLHRWHRLQQATRLEWKQQQLGLEAKEDGTVRLLDHSALNSHLQSTMRSYLTSYETSIRRFISRQLRFVLSTYPMLTHSNAIRKVASTTLNRVVLDELSPTLRAYYQSFYQSENKWMIQHIERYCNERKNAGMTVAITMKSLGIDPKVWTDEEKQQESHPVQNGQLNDPTNSITAASFPFPLTLSLLDHLFSTPLVREKCDLLQDVCKELSEEYSNYLTNKFGSLNGSDSSAPLVPSKERPPSPQLADLIADAKNPVLSTLSHFTPFSLFQFRSYSAASNQSNRSSSRHSHTIVNGSPQPHATSSTTTPTPTTLLSSDELIPLLAYIMLHLPVPCHGYFVSDLRWIEANLDDSASMGEKGFAIASLAAALQVCIELIGQE